MPCGHFTRTWNSATAALQPVAEDVVLVDLEVALVQDAPGFHLAHLVRPRALPGSTGGDPGLHLNALTPLRVYPASVRTRRGSRPGGGASRPWRPSRAGRSCRSSTRGRGR